MARKLEESGEVFFLFFVFFKDERWLKTIPLRGLLG